VLAAFVALTALSVKHSVHTRADNAQRDRMEGLVYGILGAAELDAKQQLAISTYMLPDGLRQPQSGLSARIFDADGREIWQSESTLPMRANLNRVNTGQWRFRQQTDNDDLTAFSLRFGFSWANADQPEQEFNILLLTDAEDHLQQLAEFDQQLWTSLLTSALLLLLLQLLVLMWGLKPLNKISRGLQRIREGVDEELDMKLPQELRPVAYSLNTLLHSERNRRSRYKNVIHDLAHSLKTPLTVMHNLAHDDAIATDQRQTLQEHTHRMKDIIAYHIRRAAMNGSRPLGPAVPVRPLLERLEYSLLKVYADRDICMDIAVKKGCRLRVDESDVLEIFGNLLENACKYGAQRIVVEHRIDKPRRKAIISVHDDGPGFPDGLSETLLKRGARADTRVDGQGLGLAVCNELVSTYGGSLTLSRSDKLGGAQVSVYLSATM
jgi:two-component system sensor histidine kinase PhoQ